MILANVERENGRRRQLRLVTTGFCSAATALLQNEAFHSAGRLAAWADGERDGAWGDPSLPSADAALRRTPKSATDATRDTELTPAERDKAMPLPGQANDHSNPEFAKRGDDSSPAKSARK
jgi:hypothetical protein